MATYGNRDVAERPRALPTRSLGELLNETFAIYGRHFWPFIGLVAVVQVPVRLLTYGMGSGPVGYGVAIVLGAFATLYVYAALVCAVGQHYVAAAVDINACYRRVWWRIASLTLLTLILGACIALGVILGFLVIPAIILAVYLVYWSVAVPAVIVEGHKPAAALRRSFRLVRENWWRVFGITLVILLVSLGLGLVIGAPFYLISWIVSPAEPTALSNAVELGGGMVVALAVPPVASIAGTLLYYDLRVRKEDYSFAILSREMGVAAE